MAKQVTAEVIKRIERPFRTTNKGAQEKSHIFSLRQKRELAPHKSERSRSLMSGKDLWFLLPGLYVQVSVKVTNTGRRRRFMRLLEITTRGGEELHPYDLKDDGWLQPLLPSWVKDTA